jgi:membrane fusion protein, multidrug efflux system
VQGLRKVAVGILSAVLLATAGGFGWYWWTAGRYLESTHNAYVEADISVVAPKVAGYVREVRVTDNESVRRGVALAVIDGREVEARLLEARARHSARLAALESLKREAELQSSTVVRARADVESAAAEHDRATLDLARYEGLSKAHLISAQRLDLARAEVRKTRAALESAQAALAVEQRRVALIASRHEEARAAMAEAGAAVTQAELDVENMIVRAPVDGMVGNRTVRIGQYVRAGTPMMVVAPLRSTYVIANFKETQLGQMRPGQRVTLDFDAYPETSLAGKIESFAPAAGSRFAILPPENATGNFTKIVQRIPVRIRLPAEHALSGRIRPGMSVIATVDTRLATTDRR